MSKTRLILRIFLVLCLLVMIWLAYRVTVMGRPDYYWKKSRAAAEAGDWQAARICLQNLVKQFPEDSQAHRSLAEAHLKEAKAAGHPADYATHPPALHHLAEAAKLRPDDLALQKQVLDALLACRQMPAAVEAARHVIRAEPNHAGACFALLWQAVQQRSSETIEEALAGIDRFSPGYMFQALALAAEYYQTARQTEQIEQTLRSAADCVLQLDPARISELPTAEFHALARLLPVALAQAPDANVAGQWAAATIALCEAVTGAKPAAAGLAAQVILVLKAKYPSESDGQQFASLLGRAEQLWNAAISDGQADPVVYHQAAMAALERGERDSALKSLQAGLTAGAKLPAERRLALLDLQLAAAQQLIALGRYAEAETHVQSLLTDGKSAGWGHLLAGDIALREGKIENSQEHFLQAQKLLGDTLIVRASLANVCLALGRWQEAIEQIEALRGSLQSATAEQRARIAQLLGSGERIQLGLLRAHLALKAWDKAQAHLEALAGTELEPQAIALAAAWLSSQNRQDEARQLLAAARARLPRDLVLLRVEVAMLRQAGKADEALSLAKEFAAAAPEDLRSQLVLCEARLKNEQYAELLEQLKALQPLAKTSQERFALAAFQTQALLATGKPKEALAVIEPFRNDPKAAAVAGLLGAASQWNQNDLAAVEESLAEAQQADPRSGLLTLLRGRAAAARGEHQAAANHLAKLLEVTSLHDRAGALLLGSLMTLAGQKSPQEALKVAEELLAQHADNPWLLLAKADLQLQQGQADAALQTLADAEQVAPQAVAVPYVKAFAWLQKSRPEPALAELQRALKLQPNHLPSLQLAAQAGLALGQSQTALDYAQAALQKDRQLWSMSLVQADALSRLGRADEALAVVKLLVESRPDLPEARLALVVILEGTGRAQDALDACRRARERLPEHFGLIAAEIRLLAISGQIAEAEKLASKSAGDPPAAEKCLAIGQTFLTARRPQTARTWWHKALEVGSDSQKAIAHFFLGNLALQQSGDRQAMAQARDHFAAVLAAEPKHLIAGNNLAWLLATEFSQPEEAVRIAERVRGETPVAALPVNLIDTLAVAYRKSARPTDAERLLREAVASHGGQARLVLQLGLAQAESGNADRARVTLQQALQLGLAEDEQSEANRVLAALDTPPAATP